MLALSPRTQPSQIAYANQPHLFGAVYVTRRSAFRPRLSRCTSWFGLMDPTTPRWVFHLGGTGRAILLPRSLPQRPRCQGDRGRHGTAEIRELASTWMMKLFTCPNCGLALRIGNEGQCSTFTYDMGDWQRRCNHRHLGDATWCFVQRNQKRLRPARCRGRARAPKGIRNSTPTRGPP